MSHFILIDFGVLFLLLISSIKMSGEDLMSPSANVYLYSGIPNPHWTLSLDEWQQLSQLIDTLPKLSENNLGPYQFTGGLGYFGFGAHFPIISSYPDIYYVANKQQTVLSNPGAHYIFNDEHKIIEKWFINSAKHHGIPLPI